MVYDIVVRYQYRLLLDDQDVTYYKDMYTMLDNFIPIYSNQNTLDTLKGIFWIMIMAISYVRPSLLMNVYFNVYRF